MTPVVGWTVISPLKPPVLLPAPSKMASQRRVVEARRLFQEPELQTSDSVSRYCSRCKPPLPENDWEPVAPFTVYWVMVKLPAPSRLRTPSTKWEEVVALVVDSCSRGAWYGSLGYHARGAGGAGVPVVPVDPVVPVVPVEPVVPVVPVKPVVPVVPCGTRGANVPVEPVLPVVPVEPVVPVVPVDPVVPVVPVEPVLPVVPVVPVEPVTLLYFRSIQYFLDWLPRRNS